MQRKVKLGNWVGSGALKRVWIMVMEKPFEQRAFPNCSVGVKWPKNGCGKRTNRQPRLASWLFISIGAVF